MPSCPVSGQEGASCPVIANVNHEESGRDKSEFEKGSILQESQYDEVPSVQEYKNIRKHTKMITAFYAAGAETKEEQVADWDRDIQKISTDIEMCHKQMEMLQKKPQYKGHLKHKEYDEFIQNDIDRLSKKKEDFEKKANIMRDTLKWSKGVVKVCLWLEANLDDYCRKHIDGLPQRILDTMNPAGQIEKEIESKEQAADYARKLDEIVHNLNESRDFFEASVDGRLDKYQEIEKAIILDQLKAIREYPKDNERRQFVEKELLADLAHVEENLEEGQTGMKRRHQMLDMHLEFLNVLTYYRNKMKVLGEVTDLTEQDFVSKYSQNFEIPDEE